MSKMKATECLENIGTCPSFLKPPKHVEHPMCNIVRGYIIMNHYFCTEKQTIKQYNLYTGCPRRNVPDFGRVFLMVKYTDITQNTYVQS
jgi:hypothetical protein